MATLLQTVYTTVVSLFGPRRAASNDSMTDLEAQKQRGDNLEQLGSPKSEAGEHTQTTTRNSPFANMDEHDQRLLMDDIKQIDKRQIKLTQLDEQLGSTRTRVCEIQQDMEMHMHELREEVMEQASGDWKIRMTGLEAALSDAQQKLRCVQAEIDSESFDLKFEHQDLIACLKQVFGLPSACVTDNSGFQVSIPFAEEVPWTNEDAGAMNTAMAPITYFETADGEDTFATACDELEVAHDEMTRRQEELAKWDDDDQNERLDYLQAVSSGETTMQLEQFEAVQASNLEVRKEALRQAEQLYADALQRAEEQDNQTNNLWENSGKSSSSDEDTPENLERLKNEAQSGKWAGWVQGIEAYDDLLSAYQNVCQEFEAYKAAEGKIPPVVDDERLQ